MTIAIRNCIIITQNGARETIRGSIEIEGNIISKVAKGSSHIDTSDIVIDGDSHIAMPGLINTHTHVGMSAVRGNVETKNLDAFLKDTEEFDRRNNERRIEASTLIGVAEMLRTGTTAFLDLYYSEDVIAKVVDKIGMRAYLAWVVLDKEFTTQKGNPIDNARRFVESRLRSSIIKPAFGLQGVYVCSKETISKTEELAAKYNTVLHMHLSETKEEIIGSLKRYGKRPVEWLYDNGLLSKRLVAAHAVWLENKEIKMLAKSGVTVSYNVASNMRLGSGRARIGALLKNGVNVTLGTDSTASNDNLDMFQGIKIAALENRLSPSAALDFATVNAARALGYNGGSIEEGKLADIIMLDARQPQLLLTTERNAQSNAVYSAEGLNVDCSIIDGKVLMENGEFTTLDYDAAIEKINSVFD
ncbi:MAG: amidohydrolase family protein [Candidatus Micrarchaeia archaeon]